MKKYQTLETQVWQSYKNKDYRHAIFLCNEINTQYPNEVNGWLVTAELSLKLNNPKITLAVTNKALQINVNDTLSLFYSTKALISLGNNKEALRKINAIDMTSIQEAGLLTDIGCILQSLNSHELAKEYFLLAIIKQPDSATHHYNIATSYRFFGDLDKAEVHLNKAIKLNPNDAEAHHLRSGLVKQTQENNHIKEIQSTLASNSLSKNSQVKMFYALAKELEDIKDYSLSFKTLKQGADIQHTQVNYEIDKDVALFELIKSNYNANFFQEVHRGYKDSAPIFVLGLPRTGSTLVEQILSQDNSVISAGEINYFNQELTERASRLTTKKPISNEQNIALSTKINFYEVGQSYTQRVNQYLGSDSRFIDKLPNNFLQIGAIKKALPNAKIICMRRNPLDTCYAIYKTLFVNGYPFSYDLVTLAKYYVLFDQLITHWYQQIPDSVYMLNYDELITDPIKNTQNLYDYCQLQWSKECLNFHTGAQVSTTASTTQIRQPIYSSSLEKWRHYQDELKVIIQTFERLGFHHSTA